MAPDQLIVCAASQTYPGETANGDAWQADWHEGSCRISVIDGLGHGPQAAAASLAALETLRLHPELSPRDALTACHTALFSTRGAAMSIATIDTACELLVYAGIGNVDAHLLRRGQQERLVAYRGIVGAALPRIHDFRFSLERQWLLLMHTDGIRSRFRLEDLPPALHANPQQLAETILSDWGRPSDDATIVVIRPRSDP
jgi:serine phosphatase RsbU (regulator of sigma subunit)